MANNWNTYAVKLDGQTVTVDGIQVRIEVTRDRRTGEYTSTVNGHPTTKGKKSPAYIESRRRLGDDWSFCWTGELPPEFSELLAKIERKEARYAEQREREIQEATHGRYLQSEFGDASR